MTSLDDALASSSVEFGPHPLLAYWRESDKSDDGSVNADTPTDLTQQASGAMQITHTLDDGLPDPVTMTTSADASGILTADLIGRQGLTLASSGVRAVGGTDTWDSGAAQTILTAPIPSGVIRDDFIVAVVLIDDSTANLVQTVTDPKDSWEFLGSVTDAPLSMYAYAKRRYRTGNPQLTLVSDKPVNFMSTSEAFWARNPIGMALDYRVTDIQLVAESASVTSHTVSSTLKGRGYQIAFWGSSAIGGIVPVSPMALQQDPALNGLVVMAALRPFAESGIYSASATQTPANAVMCMAAISVEPFARPQWSARRYFSPFNKDSPVYGWDRDTATVLANLRVLTSTGPVDTMLFTGQMQGISLGKDPVTMGAVSKTRIRLNQTVSLPVVSGYREGLTIDWLVTWLAARGSQFVGPAPNRYTRFWAPMHGSIHSHWSQPGEYNGGYEYRPPGPPGGLYGWKNLNAVEGPFLLGMFAEQTATRTRWINVNWIGSDFFDYPDSEFPHITEAGGPIFADIFSQANSRGRLCLWIRGDAVQPAPSYSTGGTGSDFIYYSLITVRDQYGNYLGYVEFGIDSANRRPYVQMGNYISGTSVVTYAASGLLPTDGAWHFFGFYWDYAAGNARVVHNSTESSSSFWAGTYNATSQLPVTDFQGRGLLNNYTVSINSHLPISEVMFDFGKPYSAGFWDDQYPVPQAPGGTLTMRPLMTRLAGLAETEAVNAWDTLAELARNSLSSYRVNESDNLEFLPLPYFGETAQTTVSVVQDTRTNTADLEPTVDTSKTRNVVTVQFQDKRVDTAVQPMVQYNTAVEIPKGTSFITFPLDVPCVEIHGASNPGTNVNFQVLNLSSTEISTPTLPMTRHYITANSNAEGGGTVLSAFQVAASIITADALSVTIKFVNGTGATAYLANNGDQVPVLQIMGYGLRASDGYSTVRDVDSVKIRGERGLSAQMDWIHDRSTAENVAATLLTTIGQVRPQLLLTVMGDPRRKPGQLITVLDSEDTAVSGNWRILGVQHNVNGPQYTQDLLVVQVLPVAVWDGLDGWDSAVWS
jgi:hypothetical protein